ARFEPGEFHRRLHLKLVLKADGVAPSRTLGAQDAEVKKRLAERRVAPQGQQEQAHGALQALLRGGGGLISSLKGRQRRFPVAGVELRYILSRVRPVDIVRVHVPAI